MKKFKLGEAIIFDPKWKIEDVPDHPLKRNDVCYFLSYIPNVPGHCIVIKWNGASKVDSVITNLHPGDFRTAKDEEI